MHENSLHVKILFTIGVVDPGEKPNKRQLSNTESSSPCHEVLVDPSFLDIGSVDKEIDSFDNSTAHVERHNTSEGNEGLQYSVPALRFLNGYLTCTCSIRNLITLHVSTTNLSNLPQFSFK